MTVRAAAVALFVLAGAAPSGAGAAPRATPDPLSVGTSVRAAIAALGTPDVVTTDVGHVWTWHRSGGAILRATTDDDGTIQMIDMLAAAGAQSVFSVPPPANLALTFNQTTVAVAESKLSSLADFGASATLPDSGEAAIVRGYKLSPENELVLLFDKGAQALREAFVGNRMVLERSGLVPGAPAGSYKAPVLQKLGAADFRGPHEGVTYVRIAVAADGSVRNATVFVTSGDSDLDSLAIASAKLDTFAPATVNGSPTDGVYFYRENFLVQRLPPH